MSQALRHPLTELPRGGMLCIADGRAHVVAVFEGQVWLTQHGDPRDVFLEAGDSFSFDRPGVTLLQALRDARLLVSEPVALEHSSAVDAQALHRRARALRDATLAALIGRAVAALESVLLGAVERVKASLSATAQRPLRSSAARG